MVLAELAGGVAHRPERRGDRRRLVRHAERRARLTHAGEAGSNRQLAGDQIGAARRAARLGVVVDEAHPFGGEPIHDGGLPPALVVPRFQTSIDWTLVPVKLAIWLIDGSARNTRHVLRYAMPSSARARPSRASGARWRRSSCRPPVRRSASSRRAT